MKTKHKEIGWPPPKNQSNQPTQNMSDNIVNDSKVSDSLDDSKSELDTSFDKISDGDVSGNSEPPAMEDVASIIYPKMLSTPTKAMVKAMAPGFKLNTPGFENVKPMSPITTEGSSPKPNSADVYDFNEDDNDSGIPIGLSKKYDKAQIKSPGRPSLPPASSLELLEAMEPMNLSADNKPVQEQVKVTKNKKRSATKKKKLDAVNNKRDAGTDDARKDTKLNQSTDVKPNVDASQTEEQVSAEALESQRVHIQGTDSDSGVRSQESLDHGSCSSIAEEHVSENVPPASSSSTSGSVEPGKENDEEPDMEQQPVAVPSHPEPYPDPCTDSPPSPAPPTHEQPHSVEGL